MIVHVQLLLLMETVTITATVRKMAILGENRTMSRALQVMATVTAKMKILTVMSPFHALENQSMIDNLFCNS